MDRWLRLLAFALAAAATLAGIVAIIGWRARRFEERVGTGPDDGGRYEGGSDLDHLALDQARDDALHHE